jgi:hypothetical protein
MGARLDSWTQYAQKLRCITPMLGMSNVEVAWRTMGLRLFAPGSASVASFRTSLRSTIERRHNSDFVIYC